MIADITVDGNTYHSYVSLAEADIELAVAPSRSATWSVLSDAQKGVMLVAATRRLDLLRWKGWRTGGAEQDTQWPRDGLTYSDGTAVPDDAIPTALKRATAYQAAAIAADSSAADTGQSQVSAITRVKAGSAEVEFATPTAGQRANAIPRPVQDETVHDLIAQWLLGAGVGVAATGAEAFGTEEQPERDDYGLSRGYS